MLKQIVILLVLGFLAVQAGFTWKNCDSSAPVQIKQVNLKPDPVLLRAGAKLTFGGAFNVKGDAGKDYRIKVKLSRKAWFWIKIPCIKNVGSCDYDARCEDMKKLINQNQCPLPRQVYSFPQRTITVPRVNIPSFLASGKYWARVDITDKSNNRRIACIEVYFTVKT